MLRGSKVFFSTAVFAVLGGLSSNISCSAGSFGSTFCSYLTFCCPGWRRWVSHGFFCNKKRNSPPKIQLECCDDWICDDWIYARACSSKKGEKGSLLSGSGVKVLDYYKAVLGGLSSNISCSAGSFGSTFCSYLTFCCPGWRRWVLHGFFCNKKRNSSPKIQLECCDDWIYARVCSSKKGEKGSLLSGSGVKVLDYYKALRFELLEWLNNKKRFFESFDVTKFDKLFRDDFLDIISSRAQEESEEMSDAEEEEGEEEEDTVGDRGGDQKLKLTAEAVKQGLLLDEVVNRARFALEKGAPDDIVDALDCLEFKNFGIIEDVVIRRYSRYASEVFIKNKTATFFQNFLNRPHSQ